ncbi:MAG TPA: primosomal protein N' [Syntrophales bacterium]|nr:primosomal protein N' [Syntrophales bacterium]
MFATVAVNIPSEKTFTYAVPENLRDEVRIGKRVLVPFGRRKLTGFVIERSPSSDHPEAREILECPDEEPLFDARDLRFYRWVASYYLYPLGKALAEILPAGTERKSERWVLPPAEAAPAPGRNLSPAQKSILAHLAETPRGIAAKKLARLLGGKDIGADLRRLHAAGLLRLEERLSRSDTAPKTEKVVSAPQGIRETDGRLTKRQRELVEHVAACGSIALPALGRIFPSAAATVRTLSERGVLAVRERETYRCAPPAAPFGDSAGHIVLNSDQESARARIAAALQSGGFAAMLLHGVTGSGKTEVYLRAMEETLKTGGGAVYLVPEIALTPQLLCRVRDRFPGEEIAVLHSGIPKTSRYDQWRRIRSGGIRIVVGARSAVFSPVRNLRLIVVDEEHDTSYKQDDRLPYNGRDMAVVRAQQQEALVVLGSATPSVQTYSHAAAGRYALLQLPRRVEERPMPSVEIADLRGARSAPEPGGPALFSPALAGAIRETLGAGQQTLLFLNRRGFSTFVVCLECGYSFKCRNCSVTLTHHAGAATLQCHYCDYAIKAPPLCPACGGGNVRSHGVGTERVEAEAKRLFPEARIGRMDRDTTARKGALDGILRSFAKGEIDILIGTQMIAKGHDYAGVTLVGIVSADVSLNLPDFRAAERTFQLLTQVAGRSGRGNSPGRVIIQTFNPGHYAVLRAKEHDFEGFFREEIALREALGYPPFLRIVLLNLSALNRRAGEEAVQRLGAAARTLAASRGWASRVEICGPAASPVGKIRGRYRWQILLKGGNVSTLHAFAAAVVKAADGSGLEVRPDVDPVHFL